MTDDQTVTQADRDAAADMLKAEGIRSEALRTNIIAGHCDALPCVQAFARHRTAHSGEGRENDKPPRHWAANDKCNRHPQSTEEWDWHADRPSEDSCERSIRRLNFAVDRGDPDAPNQMALVLRVDLSRVLGRLTHYTAPRELLMQKLDGEGRSNGAGEIDAGLVERFRKALERLADSHVERDWIECVAIARAALAQPEGAKSD